VSKTSDDSIFAPCIPTKLKVLKICIKKGDIFWLFRYQNEKSNGKKILPTAILPGIPAKQLVQFSAAAA